MIELVHDKPVAVAFQQGEIFVKIHTVETGRQLHRSAVAFLVDAHDFKSGIVIGQAAEFDYAGTQACRALRAEGVRTILVNSNPATIMTDPQVADVVYLEPLTVAAVEAVIAREKPEGLLAGLGGQTALNLAVALSRAGVLERHGVRLLGTPLEAIEMAEDRELFRDLLDRIGQPYAPSHIVEGATEAEREASIAAARDSGARLILPGNVYVYGAVFPRFVGKERVLHFSTLRGKVGERWNWEISYGYGRFHQEQNRVNLLNLQNLKYAINAEFDPAAPGDLSRVRCVDAAARAAGCVPVNLFGPNSITSSPRITANGSFPTSGSVTSTAWPRPSGSPWRT